MNISDSMNEMAKEIAELRADNARLREELKDAKDLRDADNAKKDAEIARLTDELRPALALIDKQIEMIHEQGNKIVRLREVILKRGLWREAPCILCGYNGQGYFQPDTHPCAREGR